MSNDSDTVKLFVGTDPNGCDTESLAVLEYSARLHCSMPLEIEFMKISKEGFWSGWNSQLWATPFSGFRWGVPARCGYKGKAIYCDSDFIFMDDLANLWNQKFEPGKAVMAKGGQHGWRYCLAFWNCEEAQKYILPIDRLRSVPEAHSRMMHFFMTNPALVQQFKGNWNCVDGEDYQDLKDPDIRAIHYSSMQHQPQLKYALPRLAQKGQKHWFDGQVETHWRQDLINLFDKMLDKAIEANYNPRNYETNEEMISYAKQSQAGYSSAHQWVKKPPEQKIEF